MSRATVVHCKRAVYDTYIGRANGSLPQSKWANPWVIGKDGTRDEVIDRYANWIKTQPDLMAALPELRNKTLGCWCAPQRCHGHVLAQMVEELPNESGWTVAPNEPMAVCESSDPAFKEMFKEPLQYKMTNILPCFTSHYSFSSILTLEEAGKTAPGNPASICDIAKTNGLKEVVLVEDRIDGFLEGYKHIQKAGIAQLIYGLRMVVVPDMLDKTPETARQESRVIIFVRNSRGYNDLIRLWNRGWTDGHFTTRDASYGRIDGKTLREFWTPNLSLALPFFSSFLARNTLTFASIVPDFPVPANEITLFREVDSGLPFAHLIDAAVTKFAADTGAQIQPVKSIYYADAQSFDSYVTYRAILNRETFGAPGVDNLASNRFSFEDYLRVSKEGAS
jgi:hypothetical protein